MVTIVKKLSEDLYNLCPRISWFLFSFFLCLSVVGMELTFTSMLHKFILSSVCVVKAHTLPIVFTDKSGEQMILHVPTWKNK